MTDEEMVAEIKRRLDDLEAVVLALVADRMEPTLEQQHKERVARLRAGLRREE